MTGKQIYDRAVALLGLGNEDVAYYEEFALHCLNQMLADTLWQENALRNAKGMPALTAVPKLSELNAELPYDAAMTDECFAYGLAALLTAEEDIDAYRRMQEAYETRRQYYMPCYETEFGEGTR